MKRSMIAVVSVAAVMLAAGAAQAAIVYQTGFEPTTYAIGNLGGQDGWVNNYGTDFTVQNAIVKSGSQAVNAATYLSGSALHIDSRPLGSVSVGATDIVTLSYDQYLPDAWFEWPDNGIRALTVYLRAVNTHNQLVLSTWNNENQGQRIGFGTDGIGTHQMSVDLVRADLADKWSNLRLVVNNGTGRAEAFLNGSSLGWVGFTAGDLSLSAYTKIDLCASSGSSYGDPVNAYVDNLSLSIIPEPATLALLVAGGAAIVASRRRRA